MFVEHSKNFLSVLVFTFKFMFDKYSISGLMVVIDNNIKLISLIV